METIAAPQVPCDGTSRREIRTQQSPAEEREVYFSEYEIRLPAFSQNV